MREARLGHAVKIPGTVQNHFPNAVLNERFCPARALCGTGHAVVRYTRGPWLNVSHRYLGLKFIIKGKVHYGWARLNVQSGVATLTGYSYETIPNKPIIAGKPKGPDVITLEPASLGHLARGASGLSAWRTTNSVAASH